MKLLIATDAWRPQVNGVVRTLERVSEELGRAGVAVTMLTPADFRTMPMPTYPEIRLALALPGTIARKAAAMAPDGVHIATEGPIGYAIRRWCLATARPFTTSFHTRFPEYLAARLPVPPKASYAVLRRFHNAGRGCMVATRTLETELAERGFTNLLPWSRGVDAELFRPRPDLRTTDRQRPVFLFVGRVAVEKNIRAFLELDLPGIKRVVGDGPAMSELRTAFPDAEFAGTLTGEALARAYADADVFVFPSRTDTYGIVLLEALASGLPVAAFPVPGPADVIGDSGVGVLDEDLGKAAVAALSISRDDCRAFALRHSWAACARQFLDNVVTAQDLGRDFVPLAEAAAH
ncbi:glycosyltransferase family 4 protein [Bauldia litoralis]|uniref:glycosyltransferase family 4 protein n=1 Tax=Bauldia litoralis TaxID=665467 RepID=UPI003299CD1F